MNEKRIETENHIPGRRAADPPIPERKRPAHHPPIERANQPVILFVTVCTKNKQPILASPEIHQLLHLSWSQSQQWVVGHYLIMPDHIHLFCSPAHRESEPVGSWIAFWKRAVSRQRPDLQPIWQRDAWDTQLRHADHYQEKWQYVRLNPVRAGLTGDPDEWPYQGCIQELRW